MSLKVTAIVRSYAGGITNGSVDVLTLGGGGFPINLQYVSSLNCSTGYFPYGIPGKGFGIYRQGGGQTADFLFDIDSTVNTARGVICEDGQPDSCSVISRALLAAWRVVERSSPFMAQDSVRAVGRRGHGLYNLHAEFSAVGYRRR